MRVLTAIFLVCISPLFSACEQGEGQPCEVRADCEDGLLCQIEETGSTGQCVASEPEGDEPVEDDDGE